jgi:hypothetical protein
MKFENLLTSYGTVSSSRTPLHSQLFEIR